MAADRIEPAPSPEIWARLNKSQNHGQFAGITVQGGNDYEIGATAEREGRLRNLDDAEAHDNAKRYVAAIAALNAALSDSDPRKITRETVDRVRGAGENLLGLKDGERLERIADALESYLPPAT